MYKTTITNFDELKNMIHYSSCASGLMDKNHEIVALSPKTLDLFGLKSINAIRGKTAFDLPGQLTDCAQDFIEQDEYVFNNKKRLETFDIATYPDGVTRFFQKEKFHVKTQCGFEGIMYHSRELHNNTLKALLKIFLDDKHYVFGDDNAEQASVQINEALPKNLKLTRRQFQIIFYLLKGKTAKETAKILNLSSKTIEAYLSTLKMKFNCHSRSELIDFAIQEGLLFFLPKGFITNCSTITAVN